MSALRALVEHFVAPPDEAPYVAPPPVPTVPPAVALLCRARHARSAGGILGLRLAQRHGVRAGLVAVWTGDTGGASPGTASGPTTREARRVARACAGRDLIAHATGRVVLVDLPAAEDEAAAAARRAFGVAAALPTVLVVAGARDTPMGELLAARDLVLVAGDDNALTDLAVAALQHGGVAARRCALPAAPAAAAAMRGLPLGPAARRACDLALEGAP